MRRPIRTLLNFSFLALVFGLIASPLRADPLTIMRSFSTGGGGPTNPNGPVQISTGEFYYTSYAGGSAGVGTIYKITPSGTYTLLHSFNDGSVASEGHGPYTGLVNDPSAGVLYGMTSHGGTAGFGTVYKVTYAGVVTTLHHFGDGSVANDGTVGQGQLILGVDGKVYGMTAFGGSANKGTLFKMTAAGAVTILRSFGDGSVANDGAVPGLFLVQSAGGKIYGVTYQGGVYNKGVVFSSTTSGIMQILRSFGGPGDGESPVKVIQATDGNLYGTTQFGGTYGGGVAFKMGISGGTYSVLKHFGSSATDGKNPGPLMQTSKGRFYGMTEHGGNTSAFGGKGLLYELTSTGTYKVIHLFAGATTDAEGPVQSAGGILEGQEHLLYGVSQLGGASGQGAAFKFTRYTVKNNFGTGTLGEFPQGGLTLGTDGLIYGLTHGGGTPNKGTAFKMVPSTGVTTTIHQFSDGSTPNDGYYPYAPLNQSSGGTFYATTSWGGATTFGTAYTMNTSGTVTTIHSFTSAEGSSTNDPTGTGDVISSGSLTLGADGNYYAAWGARGTYGRGTIYRMTPSGTVTVLKQFGSAGTDGSYPTGKLTRATDGNFYGVTRDGGPSNNGTFFRITPTGTFTTLYNFAGGATDGSHPTVGMIQATDGYFYGTTLAGGSTDGGIVFRLTTAGTEVVLHHFGTSGEGTFPQNGVIQGNDGGFYGTTLFNGGGIFWMNASGLVSQLYAFGTVANDTGFGSSPLLQFSDGTLYGETLYSGTAIKGCVFELIF